MEQITDNMLLTGTSALNRDVKLTSGWQPWSGRFEWASSLVNTKDSRQGSQGAIGQGFSQACPQGKQILWFYELDWKIKMARGSVQDL